MRLVAHCETSMVFVGRDAQEAFAIQVQARPEGFSLVLPCLPQLAPHVLGELIVFVRLRRNLFGYFSS